MQDICTYGGDNKNERRYQLRNAAGLYWLIDMKQSGASYVSPLPLNEGGAQIWQMLASGMSEDAVCEQLCRKYEISSEQAHEDVRDFIAQIQAKKFDFGGVG